MKKLFTVLFLLFAITAGYAVFVLPGKAQDTIETALKNLGFKEAHIEKTSIGLTSIHAQNITLDKDGFNQINSLKINLSWPDYLTHSQIKSIKIATFKVSSLSNDFTTLLAPKQEIFLEPLYDLPVDKITIKQVIWDTSTAQGAIRVEGSVIIQQQEQSKHIQASLTAAQHQLTMDSKWTGTLDKDGTLQLDGNISALNINYNPVRISRGSGWISVSANNNKKYISGQLDAGSGALFDIPTNNISLLIGKEEGYYPILFRAEASGIENVRLTMDMHLSAKPEETTFNTSLDIGNVSDFLNLLKQQKVKPDLPDPKKIEQANILLTYMPERRFSGGPIPFDIQIKEKMKESLKGTFLIYPDSLDIRGTAEAEEDMVKFLKSLLSISDQNISGNVIRLDGNLKNSLQHPNSQK